MATVPLGLSAELPGGWSLTAGNLTTTALPLPLGSIFSDECFPASAFPSPGPRPRLWPFIMARAYHPRRGYAPEDLIILLIVAIGDELENWPKAIQRMRHPIRKNPSCLVSWNCQCPSLCIFPTLGALTTTRYLWILRSHPGGLLASKVALFYSSCFFSLFLHPGLYTASIIFIAIMASFMWGNKVAIWIFEWTRFYWELIVSHFGSSLH